MFSALALIALMVLIRPFSLQLFAARQQAIYSLDNAEVRHARELRAVDASQRLCGYRWDGMHMLDCPESRRRFAWAALRHPQDLADPSASSSMTPLRTRFRLASARCIARRCWRMLACPMAQSGGGYVAGLRSGCPGWLAIRMALRAQRRMRPRGRDHSPAPISHQSRLWISVGHGNRRRAQGKAELAGRAEGHLATGQVEPGPVRSGTARRGRAASRSRCSR